jgi:hypothetical protein
MYGIVCLNLDVLSRIPVGRPVHGKCVRTILPLLSKHLTSTITNVARFGRLDSSSSSSSGIYSYACSLVHSELSWWGIKSFLHLHVAHTHYGSHYSFEYFMYDYWCQDYR